MSELPENDQLFGQDGGLSQKLEHYEEREGQREMSAMIAEAMDKGEHCIVEAPTGIGKSFAYLVPAARYALAQRKKIVISTGTIALQEQLVNKDIPLIESLFPGLKTVLVKGRQNYVSLRRLQYTKNSSRAVLESREDAALLKLIDTWAQETSIGDKADLGYEPDYVVWKHIQSDRNNCRGRRCPMYDQCFFYKARAELEDADILIVNHHLYFSDLALRDDHAGILPPHDIVIFDEAHNLEDIATDHLGLHVSQGMIRHFLDGLYNHQKKGLLAEEEWAFARDRVTDVRDIQERFWRDAAKKLGDRRDDTMRIEHMDPIHNDLSDALESVAGILQECRSRCEDDNSEMEFGAHANRALGLAGEIRAICEQAYKDYVYYLTVPQGRGSISLSANPLAVGEQLQELLFKPMRSVILTSATIAADDSDRFLFFRKRLGIPDCPAKRLASPFDFKKQAKLLLNESPLDPNGEDFERCLANWLGEYLEDCDGGTFILFTSYKQLNRVHDRLRPRLDRANRFVVKQGDQMGRSQMLDLFKSIGNAVLFGTSSFWEGVDVRGDALRNVVIVKLPFEVPSHPLVEARHQAITARGGHPFMERSVPEAILRLKQGVGRLIRTKDDSGTIAICDHRVLGKSYGRYFVRALPDCDTERFQLAAYWSG